MNKGLVKFFPYLFLCLMLLEITIRQNLWHGLLILTIIITTVLHLIRPFPKRILSFIKLFYALDSIIMLRLMPFPFSSIEMGQQVLLLLTSLKLFELQTKRDSIVFMAMANLLFLTELLLIEQLYYIIPLLMMVYFSFSYLQAIHYPNTQRRHRHLLSWITISLFIATLLFFFFPRVQFPGLNWFSKLQLGMTGHSEKLTPGQIAKIIEGQEIIFRASLSTEMPLNMLYWRGSVLHQTDGFNWEKGHYRGGIREYIEPEQFSYEVDFETTYQGDLFTLSGTKYIEINRFSSALKGPEEDWSVLSANNKKLHFKASVFPFIDLSPHPKSIKFLLQVPADLSTQPTIRQAVDDISRNYPLHSTPEQKVETTLQFFEKNGFEYSTSPGIISNLEIFLQQKKGFCGHYASALANLLRLQSIPARIVTGYQGGEYNSLGGYYIVRDRHAHAWNEFWTGKKWQRVDVTERLAPARIQYGPEVYFNDLNELLAKNWLEGKDLPIATRLKLFIDLAYYRLNTRFANFDAEEQRKLVRDIKTFHWKKLIVFPILLLFALLFTTLLFKFKRREVLSPWEYFCQCATRKGTTISPDQTPAQLKKTFQQAEIVKLLHDIEIYCYAASSRQNKKQLMRRIKKVKSLF